MWPGRSPPWLTGGVRRGCTCAAGAPSTYARLDPTGGGPPYRVLRGDSQEHGIFRRGSGQRKIHAAMTEAASGPTRCRGGRVRLR
eukprot:scaffold38357_cov54-Phaeocystis_antarctica.AAC.2